MGFPLSGIKSEIYLNHIENKYILSEIKIKLYIDHAIILFNGNSRQMNIFNNCLNSLYITLEFILEIEAGSQLNYLDLTTPKLYESHDFNIYRKSIITDLTIHASLDHLLLSHKFAAYNSFIQHLLDTPKPSNYVQELETIKFIVMSNGYQFVINQKNT